MNLSYNKYPQILQMEKSCYNAMNQTADTASLVSEHLLKLHQFHQTILG